MSGSLKDISPGSSTAVPVDGTLHWMLDFITSIFHIGVGRLALTITNEARDVLAPGLSYTLPKPRTIADWPSKPSLDLHSRASSWHAYASTTGAQSRAKLAGMVGSWTRTP